MRLVLSGVICTQVRANQKHRRAGCSDEICQNGADCQEDGVHQWRSRHFALDEYSTRNDEQRAEQDDE